MRSYARRHRGRVEILFLAALCLALTGVIQIVFGVLRLGNIARFVPYPVVAGLMTGLAISLVIYELPEVLGTHGGGGADGGDGAHHGINALDVLVGAGDDRRVRHGPQAMAVACRRS